MPRKHHHPEPPPVEECILRVEEKILHELEEIEHDLHPHRIKVTGFTPITKEQ